MIVYKITNKINGKVYIGQTIRTLHERWLAHCSNGGRNGCVALRNAIRKYGKENFTVEQIDVACDRDELDLKEEYWINLYDSMNPDKGYNLKGGGKHPYFTDEVKKKLSEMRKGKLIGEKNPMYGKRMSEEQKQQYREMFSGEGNPRYGVKLTDEIKSKISNALKGKTVGEKNYFYGQHHKDETKKKISDKLKTLYQDKTNHPMYGKHPSQETIEKKRKTLSVKMSDDGNPRAKKVQCIETGEIFDCSTLAAKAFNISSSNIRHVCRGDQKTAGGYHWKFVDEVVS